MNKLFFLCLALAGRIIAGCKTNSPAAASTSSATAGGFTCVLVHGAWGGGWDWKHVADLLTADGNTVFRPTLTGQGEHSNLASTNLDLDTHIQDIVNVILWKTSTTLSSSGTAMAAWSSPAWPTACPTASTPRLC